MIQKQNENGNTLKNVNKRKRKNYFVNENENRIKNKINTVLQALYI
jgi:hypothetical protein